MLTRMTKMVMLLGFIILFIPYNVGASILETKHNLAASGPGSIKATTEGQVCIFCHTPHHAQPAVPLWNHALTTVSAFTMYDSSTLNATSPSEPGSSALLCLSCHDGTIAIGKLSSRTVEMVGADLDGRMPLGLSNLGTNLGDDHPINIPINTLEDTQLKMPAVYDTVQLDVEGRVQCVSCHDVHDNTYPPFLVKSDLAAPTGPGGVLCQSCHQMKGWEGSAHQQATDIEAGEGISVAARACRGCHMVHGSLSNSQRLLAGEEEACLKCHDGSVVGDINRSLSYYSSHPVKLVGLHDPLEEWGESTQRHAECYDCHNPHATGDLSVSGVSALAGQWGVEPLYTSEWSDPTFGETSMVNLEYQLCFRCHSSYAYGANPPVSPSRERQFEDYAQTDVARDFNPSNTAFHVIYPGRYNTAGLSRPDGFVDGWSWQSVLTCSDCHGSANNLDPTGPHGSQFGFILKGAWEYGVSSLVWTGNGDTQNHLCFDCHDYRVYINGDYGSNFLKSANGSNLHGRHGKYGCASCHAGVPHGWYKPAMIVETGDPLPYNRSTETLTVTNWSLGSWTKWDCDTSCHHGQAPH